MHCISTTAINSPWKRENTEVRVCSRESGLSWQPVTVSTIYCLRTRALWTHRYPTPLYNMECIYMMNSTGHKLVPLIWVNQHIIYVSSKLRTSQNQHKFPNREQNNSCQLGPSCWDTEDGTLWAVSTDMIMMDVTRDTQHATRDRWHVPLLRGKVRCCSPASAGAGGEQRHCGGPGDGAAQRADRSCLVTPAPPASAGWGRHLDGYIILMIMKIHDSWKDISY